MAKIYDLNKPSAGIPSVAKMTSSIASRRPILTIGLAFFLSTFATDVKGVQEFQANDRVAIVGNAFADLMHLHGYFETILRHRCADQQIMVRNFGWAGDTLTDRARPENFASEDKWLGDYQTDVIIICFGMGESFDGESGIPDFEKELRDLLRHYRDQKYNGQSAPRLILISPIAHEDIDAKSVNVAQRNADLQSYSKSMGKVAKELSISFVDLFQPTTALMQEKNGSRLTSNGIQLTEYGYWAVSQILVDAIVPGRKPMRVVIDTAGGIPDASGGTITPLRQSKDEWSWKFAADGWPNLPPPANSQIHPSLKRFQDQVVIKSLPPGKHRLALGEGHSIVATAKQWSQGVTIGASPRHDDLEFYRRAINRKNLHYFHGWRALNQVHIVGERKKSPSGRALPAELVEWIRLGEEQDLQLANIPEPSKDETWILKPTEK